MGSMPGIALALLALAIFASAQDEAVYSCVPAGNLNRNDEGACASQSTRDDCLGTFYPKVHPLYTAPLSTSCTWRRTTKDDVTDEHYYQMSSANYNYMGTSIYARFDHPLFFKYCAVETMVTAPESAQGRVYATSSATWYSQIQTGSYCMAGFNGGAWQCSTKIALPPISPNYYYYQGVYQFILVGNKQRTTEDVVLPPVLVKNMYILNCDGDKSRWPRDPEDDDRRRRLLGSDEHKNKPKMRWFRNQYNDQIILGPTPDYYYASSYELYPGYASIGFVYSFVSGSDAVRVQVKLKGTQAKRLVGGRGDDKQPRVYAYLMSSGTRSDYYYYSTNPDRCTSPCPAPVDTAFGSCTIGRRDTKCEFTVTGLKWWAYYNVMISKPGIGRTDEPPIAVEYTVDVVPNAFYSSTPTVASVAGQQSQDIAISQYQPSDPMMVENDNVIKPSPTEPVGGPLDP